MHRTRIGVAGALGRMGRALISTLAARGDLEITAVCHRPGSEGRTVEVPGADPKTLVSSTEALEACDVIIDFTTPEASTQLARQAGKRGGPALVIGTTGFSSSQEAEIIAMATAVPIVRSGNFSLGVNMLLGLVEVAARQLSARDWDIEIVEAHHKSKVDAPSGTALMLGEAGARGRNVDLSSVADRARDGLTGPRQEGAIGFSVMRGGGIIGEHSVTFAAEDEILTLSHSARDRSLFARGAIEAAVWAASCRKPGLYSMMDVLGFRRTS